MSKNTGLLIAVAVGGLFLASRSTKAMRPGAKITLSPPGMKPARVGAKEKVSAKTFTTLTKRRLGFVYAPAKMLPDGTIEFVSPRAGMFTRYVVQTEGRIFAEIK